ncbi:recombinase XerD [Planctomycetota bacterium]
MPRLSATLPKYRRHSNGKNAIVQIAGRVHYLGHYGSKASKAEYDRLIAEWLVRGRLPAAADPHEYRAVNEIILAYYEFASTYYVKNDKPTRELGLIKDVCRVALRLYGESPAEDFGPTKLKAVRQVMIDGGLSRKHINKQVSRVVRMFKWAGSEELVSASVHQSLKTVAGLRRGRTDAPDHAPVEPVPDETVQATLRKLSLVVADMVRFQQATGARPGEVCAIRPCDVDRSGEVWVFVPPSHKTEHHDRDRLVFIGPKAQAILSRYLLRSADSHCFSPQEADAQVRQQFPAS